GRLMGPSWPYGDTVEVAYALRPVAAGGVRALAARVVIPEPGLWEPERPFLYRGPLELWEDGRLCQQLELRHGLRQAVLGRRGLVWNGRPLPLKGREVRGTLAEAEARAWRAEGVNLLVAPATLGLEPLCDLADRLGFAVIGCLPEGESSPMADVLAVRE